MAESIKKSKHKKPGLIAASVIIALVAVSLSVFLVWVKPRLAAPISEPLSLEKPLTNSEEQNGEKASERASPEKPSNLSIAPIFIRPTPDPDQPPICGKDAEWIILVVGIDYRGDGFLYGLADIIRVIRVDFVEMRVNMVALPRDLLVEIPQDRFTAPGPFKINQAYLFGTPGMGHYLGEGEGAGALAEVIQYNFGITSDHYGVINFNTFVDLIDAIGGVEVDLPKPVYDDDLGNFPAGLQTLSGTQALSLARIREGYSESFRVSNQTIILRALLRKMTKPAMILKIPSLLNEFSEGFLTDLTIQEVSSLGICFLRNFDTSDLKSFEVPGELLTTDWAFIPTLNDESYVYRWSDDLVQWIYDSLLEE